jgi:hypothetical protein
MAITANNVRMKFSEFADTTAVPDAMIEMAIEEANLGVDNSWLASNVNLGLLYLTAHYLMVTISRAESATGQQVQSESYGSELKITYKVKDDVPPTDATLLDTTPYGIRYLELVGMNQPAVAII